MGNAMDSSKEAETIGLFENLKKAIQNTLAKMGDPQPPYPLAIDNSTGNIFGNGTFKQTKKHSNAYDILFGECSSQTKPLPLILGGGEETFDVLIRKAPPNLALQNYETKKLKPTQKYIVNQKDR